jgi:pimeloyl-ACP methyl ester carboxylesterase
MIYELMAGDTIRFLESVVGGSAHLVGCSDGGVVALLVALRRPDLVRKLISVASNRDGWVPGAVDPDVAPPEFLASMYVEVSPDGAEHFPEVFAKAARMHAEEPTLTADDLRGITCRTLVMIGDDDEVTLEHAAEFHRGLPNAELSIVSGTSHELLVEKPELCNTIMVDFLTTDAVPTIAPIRRAPG